MNNIQIFTAAMTRFYVPYSTTNENLNASQIYDRSVKLVQLLTTGFETDVTLISYNNSEKMFEVSGNIVANDGCLIQIKSDDFPEISGKWRIKSKKVENGKFFIYCYDTPDTGDIQFTTEKIIVPGLGFTLLSQNPGKSWFKIASRKGASFWLQINGHSVHQQWPSPFVAVLTESLSYGPTVCLPCSVNYSSQSSWAGTRNFQSFVSDGNFIWYSHADDNVNNSLEWTRQSIAYYGLGAIDSTNIFCTIPINMNLNNSMSGISRGKWFSDGLPESGENNQIGVFGTPMAGLTVWTDRWYCMNGLEGSKAPKSSKTTFVKPYLIDRYNSYTIQLPGFYNCLTYENLDVNSMIVKDDKLYWVGECWSRNIPPIFSLDENDWN